MCFSHIPCVCVWIVHSETVLFRQCWQQEVGCGFAAGSQEVADCITGGTDGGRGGEDLGRAKGGK